MKVTLPEYARRTYAPGCAPSIKTLRRRAKEGALPFEVVKEGRSYYVLLNAPRTSNPLVAAVLAG